MFEKYILPHIWNLKPYSSARDEFKGKEGVFLDANENPINSGDDQNYNRYPDPLQWAIKSELAEIKNIPQANIFLGNGSDEAIDLMIRMTCEPQNSSILICPPTYGMYEVSASINNIPVKKVNLTSNYQLDTDSILNSVDNTTKLIFICSPNNPTGNKLNRADIIKVLDQFQTGFIIIDEAYVNFSDEPSFITQLNQYPRLVVLQTLSKAYGLASLRLGMAFAHSTIIQILNKIKPPYNISGASQDIVLKALKNKSFLTSSVSRINELKISLISEMNALKQVISINKSDANFILVKFIQAQDLFDYLIYKKIVTRNRSNVVLCEDSIRITIGLKEENELLLQNIKDFYA